MRKITKVVLAVFIAITLIALFICILPLLKPDIVPRNWQTYENSRYKFSVKFPANWELGSEETNHAGREFFSSDKQIQCYAYGFQNALITEDGDPQNLEEFIDWLKQDSDFEFVDQEQIELGGKQAIKLISRQGEKIKQAVYALGEDSGRGLFCVFKGQQVWNEYQGVFEKMRGSFEINASLNGEEVFISGHEMCVNLLNNASVPLQDLQTFLDQSYTEITTISREYWDEHKLPEKVLELQAQGYTCYPMPFEVEQQEVKTIEWSCELEYGQWEYISKDNLERKLELINQGYDCEKRICYTNQSQQSFVWLCGE
ncbi:MAG: hypothetical protein ACOC6D_08260 [Atribacterota bacterium]